MRNAHFESLMREALAVSTDEKGIFDSQKFIDTFFGLWDWEMREEVDAARLSKIFLIFVSFVFGVLASASGFWASRLLTW